jgi:hypothetical protein
MRGMEVASWLATHWLDLIQSAGIVSGFIFTAYTIRRESEARKIGNAIALAERHHAIWKEFHEHPSLARVREAQVNLVAEPITQTEEVFVTSIIIHLDTLHRAVKSKMFVKVEGMRKDIGEFFSLPIPNAVWQKMKRLQNQDFSHFMETCIAEPLKL